MPEDAGFRTFALDHPQEIRIVRHRLMEERISRVLALESGSGVEDYAQYMNKIGFIAGIDLALRFCEETQEGQDESQSQRFSRSRRT